MDNKAFYSEDQFSIPRWNELPEIELYMDQVISFIDSRLGELPKHMGCSPLTKSMVNNYVKAKIIKAPVNKKYNRLSLAMIIVVYILKNCFSTDEIKRLIKMGLNLPDNATTYDRFCEAIENALCSVFSGSIHVENLEEEGREQRYLMNTFALTFACKVYARRTFLLEYDPS